MKRETAASRERAAAAAARDRAAAGAAADDGEGLARFLRGMTLGALVGAAIAGSAIWQRARNRPGRDSVTTDGHGTTTPDEDRR
jgi:hypothetical protein